MAGPRVANAGELRAATSVDAAVDEDEPPGVTRQRRATCQIGVGPGGQALARVGSDQGLVRDQDSAGPVKGDWRRPEPRAAPTEVVPEEVATGRRDGHV